jgi:CpeT/CpcT family (DUF1001)
MSVLIGMLLAAAVSGDSPDVAALEHLWSGVRDSNEQVVMSADSAASASWPLASERRVRTVVAPVQIPWLGAHVLYLEEFLEDEPQHPRRQLLLQLQPSRGGEHAVYVHLFSLARPRDWTHLAYRPQLAATIVWSDLVAAVGCDITLTRSGEQFRGGTRGDQCRDDSSGTLRHLDYQLLVGADLYWYRRRAFRHSDGQLQQEVIGFNRFEANEARLYTCRVAWSDNASQRPLQPLAQLDLYEAGGRGRFTTPDGRAFSITLHGRDWPFALDRDALLLLLVEEGRETPLATAWAQIDEQQIALQLGWLEVRCGAIVPDSDELTQ